MKDFLYCFRYWLRECWRSRPRFVRCVTCGQREWVTGDTCAIRGRYKTDEPVSKNSDGHRSQLIACTKRMGASGGENDDNK